MTKANIAGALVLPLVMLSASAAVADLGDKCLTGSALIVGNDASQIRAVRALVDAVCVCSSFDATEGRTHRDYVRCAAAAISDQVDAGSLRSKCKMTVKRYYSKSTCGKPPNLHAQTCVQRSSGSGKIKCGVRFSTRSDGTTPTNSCADRLGMTRVACPAYTHCIDAADTDRNLVIAAPGDTGFCAPSPTPTDTAAPTPTTTPTPSTTIPMLPIALGECDFDPECMDQSCMPNLSGVPSPERNSAWTAFFDSASLANIINYIPAEPACNGGGATPEIRVGDVISLNTGQTVVLLQAVSCLLHAGQTTFAVPLIPCDEAVQFAEIVGFAKIQIDAVVTGTSQGISLHGLWED